MTVSTGSGSTFASDQSVQLAVAGTATETADYTISGKTLTLPAGMGTSASMVTATVTGVDDSLDDDDETIVITGSRNGVAFGSRQTVAITDDDWPALTVTFRQTGLPGRGRGTCRPAHYADCRARAPGDDSGRGRRG